MRLWNECYEPGLRAELCESDAARLEVGEQVGRLATKRHPGGAYIDGDYPDFERALRETASAIADKSVPAIFEATFQYKGVLVRVDVLERMSRGRWRLVEVKSTASCKPVHLPDVTIQAWVLEGCGVRVGEAGILHLNRDYVFAGGDYDLDELFVFADTTEAMRKLRAKVGDRVAEMHSMLRKKRAPDIEPGVHCDKPYPCPFIDRCSEHLEELEHPIYDPEFRRSFSLKVVLPAVVPSLSYDELEIQDGMAAAIAYLQAITTEDAEERGRLQKALLAYCKVDTLAMVRLRAALRKSAGSE